MYLIPVNCLPLSAYTCLRLRFFLDYDAVLIVLGDMPLITRDTVARIIGAYHEGYSTVVLNT